MISDFKQVLKNSAVAGIGNILGKVAAFIMVPVYTTYLTPQEYGIAELLDLTSVIIGLVVGFGISAATIRFYFEYQDRSARDTVVSTAVLTSTAVMLATVAPLTFFSEDISRLVFKTPEYHAYVTLSLWNLLLSATIEIPLALLRAQQRIVLFTGISIARLVSSLGLNILFVVYFDWKIWGLLYSTFITTASIGLFLSVRTLWVVGCRFSPRILKSMLAYGLPYVPETMGMFTLHFADHFFLQVYGSMEQVGIYSLAYKFGMVPHVLFSSTFWVVWSAKRFELIGRPGSEAIYGRVLTYFVYCQLLLGLAFSLLAPHILQLVAARPFHAAARLIPVIVLSYLVFGTYYLLQTGICIQKQTKYLGLILLVTACLNLVLNYLLIPRLLSLGAALATLLSFVTMAVAAYVISDRLLPLPYEFGRLAKLFLVALSLYAVGYTLPTLPLPYAVPLKLLLAGAFPVALLPFRFYTPDEAHVLRMLTLALLTRLSLPAAR